ncbi:hypothetical protein ABT218_11345 [Streptomyces sp. NPDC001455]|uniref:hypothetical protein n=1 Tax=unclassified Streptomyces TaxID=2593676 RepID=UPI0033233EAC
MTTVTPNRMPQGEELALLMRCAGYRFNRNGVAAGATAPPKQEDLVAAQQLGWTVGVKQEWTAREVLTRAIDAVQSLDVDSVLSAFIAGIGGSALRGRQIVISYAWACHLADAPRGPQAVPDCGLEEVEWVDVTEVLVRIACGWAWNELPARYLPDLEVAAAQGLPEATDEDRNVLDALLDHIAAQPEGTTPGQLEKSIARARLLPRTDKYQRYGILIALAELGVLPNTLLPPSIDRFVSRTECQAAYRRVRGAPRSDITLPLAAWRGGLDTARVARLANAGR